jgi:hypothetical protein
MLMGPEMSFIVDVVLEFLGAPKVLKTGQHKLTKQNGKKSHCKGCNQTEFNTVS